MCIRIALLGIISFISLTIKAQPIAALSTEEKKDGWQLLFDGTGFKGWHSYNKKYPGAEWEVKDGCIHLVDRERPVWGVEKDLITDNNFTNFDLKLEWKIAPNGNSGVMFWVQEDPNNKPPYFTGPEMQVLDDFGNNPSASLPKQRSGDLFNVIPASQRTTKPAGEWNEIEINCNNGFVKFYQNGVNIINTNVGDGNWRNLVTIGYGDKRPLLGVIKTGKIDLQDLGDEVWYRNIKIKTLDAQAENTVSNTVTPNNEVSDYVLATPPTQQNFDQRRLPPSSIDNWQKGLEYSANGLHEKAIRSFEQAALQGNADAAYELAEYCESKRSVSYNLPLAKKWYQFAQKNGNVRSAYRLAIMTYLGEIPDWPKDSALSMEKNAALNGSLQAALQMSIRYRFGRNNIPQSAQHADNWLEKVNKMKYLAAEFLNQDSILIIFANMFDGIVARTESVALIIDPLTTIEPSPNHKIASYRVTEFEGHIKANGKIDDTLPFEIECQVTADPPFFPWLFRVNNVIYNGQATLVITRMTWPEYLVYSQRQPQYYNMSGPDDDISIHELDK